MRFSIAFSFVARPDGHPSHRETFKEFLKLAPLIDELGYRGIHVTEHHFQEDGWLPSPLLALAAAAAITKRVKLVTNIMVIPLYAPVQLLEDLASLDNLSDGRIVLGVSPGYASEEFSGRGVAYNDRFKIYEETLDFLQKAWANPDDIAFEGRFVRVPSLKLVPKPVQKTLPIWAGVSGPKLLERTAKRRFPLSASPRHTNEVLKEHRARYLGAAARAGYAPEEWIIFRECLVLDTTSEAEKYGAPGTDGLFGIYGRKSAEGERALHTDGGALVVDPAMASFRNLASRYIIGDPDLAIERIKQLRADLDPTEVVLRMSMPGIPTDVLERSIRLFAKDVMPAFAGR